MNRGSGDKAREVRSARSDRVAYRRGRMEVDVGPGNLGVGVGAGGGSARGGGARGGSWEWRGGGGGAEGGRAAEPLFTHQHEEGWGGEKNTWARSPPGPHPPPRVERACAHVRAAEHALSSSAYL